MSYNQIPQNPYIVGNPIQSSSMFYGRNEDFLYIKDKLQKEARGLIITLAGERRSGKTSILFQILNGRLGEGYLPFFVDMQAMAAVESDAQFLSRLDNVIRTQLTIQVSEQDYQGNKWSAFENFLHSIKEAYTEKKIIFLLDEYEIIENKIDKQMITTEMITFFANLMENHNIFFLFTGSNKLEDRNATYWKTLFSKSQYRKITFLQKKDCLDLITKPVENYVIYTPDQLDNIWRLTAGQPFYTQIFCQNMVDRLQLEQHNEVLDNDIDAVIKDIVDNPMPQMIYFWQELDAKHKLTLSILAEVINTKDDWVDCDDLMKCLKNQKIDINIHASDFHTAMEELYHNDILTKKGKQYQFRVDIFRFWIKQEQNVWKLLSEIKIDKEKRPVHRLTLSIGFVLMVLLIIGGLFRIYIVLKPTSEFGMSKNREAINLYKQAQDRFAENDTSFALQNVNRALAADSSFFMAKILKADILKAQNNLPEALKVYQNAENQYYYSTDVGEKISSIPISFKTDDKLAQWRTTDTEDYFIYDMLYISHVLSNDMIKANKNHNLYIYSLRKNKWFSFQNSVCLMTDKKAIFFYNIQNQALCKFDVNRGKTIWKTKLTGLLQNSLIPDISETKHCKYLILRERKQLFLFNQDTGKLVIRKVYPNNIQNVFFLSKDNRLWVVFDQMHQILSLPDLSFITQKTIPNMDVSFEKVNNTIISSNDSNNHRTELLEYKEQNGKLNRITNIFAFNNESGNGTMLSKKLLYVLNNNKPQVFNLQTKQLYSMSNLSRYQILSMYSNQYEIGNYDDRIFFFTEKDLLIYNLKSHKVQEVIALNKLTDSTTSSIPTDIEFDKYRKRIICLYSDKTESNNVQSQVISIVDIKKKSIIYSNRLDINTPISFIQKNMYSFIQYDVLAYANLIWNEINFVLMNPDNYQVSFVAKLDMMLIYKNKLFIMKNRDVLCLNTFPRQDNKYLQKIQENIILLSFQLKQPKNVIESFDKLIKYAKTVNDVNVLRTIINTVQIFKPEMLGYYVTKCVNLSNDLNSLKPDINYSMQLIPSARFKDKLLPHNSYDELEKLNDELVARVDENSVFRINNNQPDLLYQETNTNNIYVASGISSYIQNTEPPKLNIVDRQNHVFTHNLPFPKQMRAAINWYDENNIVYITQEQFGDGFNYEMRPMDIYTGNKSIIWQKWSSSLHLIGMIQRENKVGLMYSDSLAKVYYVKTPQSKLIIPDFSQILSVNSKDIENSDQIMMNEFPKSVITYISSGKNTSVTLSKDELSSAQFMNLTKQYIQWFDVRNSVFEPIIELDKPCSISHNEIEIYDSMIDDKYIIQRGKDVENNAFFNIAFNCLTGAVSDYQVLPASNDRSSITYKNYSLMESSLNIGMVNIKLYKQTANGKLALLWEKQIPYDFGYLYNIQSGICTLICNLSTNNISNRHLVYLSETDGHIIKSFPILNDMQYFSFTNQPPILFHKKLGFYELPAVK